MSNLTGGQCADVRQIVREEIERAFNACRCHGRICNCGKREMRDPRNRYATGGGLHESVVAAEKREPAPVNAAADLDRLNRASYSIAEKYDDVVLCNGYWINRQAFDAVVKHCRDKADHIAEMRRRCAGSDWYDRSG